MRYLKLFLILKILIAFSGCNLIEKTSTEQFYFENKEILNLIVKEMYDQKSFTFLYLYQKSFFIKLLTADFSGDMPGTIEKSGLQEKNVTVNMNIANNNFENIINTYLLKTKEQMDEKKINNLKTILHWMKDNNIEVIRVKTPEFNSVSIMLGFNYGLIFQKSEIMQPDMKELTIIEDNWYYVTYK